MSTEGRVKAAVKGRQAMDAMMRKNMAAKLKAAALITELWRRDLPVELLVGFMCSLGDMTEEEKARVEAHGTEVMEALTSREEDPGRTLITDPIPDVDLHVAFPCRPNDALDEALTSAGLRCYSDKRLSADKPRTYQGRGRASEIQTLIGETGAIYVKSSLSTMPGDGHKPARRSIAASSEQHDPPSAASAEVHDTAALPPSPGHAEALDEPEAPATETTVTSELGSWPGNDARYSIPSNVGVNGFGDA